MKEITLFLVMVLGMGSTSMVGVTPSVVSAASAALVVCFRALKIFLKALSESTIKMDRSLPQSSELMRGRMGSTSEAEKLVGNFVTASMWLLTFGLLSKVEDKGLEAGVYLNKGRDRIVSPRLLNQGSNP